MILNGLHLLLTYQCTFECEHCFVFGSPFQNGTMTLPQIRLILQQGKELGTVRSIYFEGGEPLLYYATLLAAVREAHAMGFDVGIVSNAFWATSLDDALEALRPFAGLVDDLSVSSDLFHFSEKISRQSRFAAQAADQLGIPLGVISIARPEERGEAGVGQIPEGDSGVMYRGRAAVMLVERASLHPWEQFDACPHEDLVDPGRVHVDPLGYVHLCQGITIGNLFTQPLSEIAAHYDPAAHPVAGVLLRDGPAGLVRAYDLPHAPAYADACHLCYSARLTLRQHFTEILAPDQVYGVY